MYRYLLKDGPVDRLKEKLKTIILILCWVRRLEGYILSFRRGQNKYYPGQVLIDIKDIRYSDAYKVIGKKVVWIHPVTGEKFVGRIVRMHGRKGKVIAYFDHHLPGQAVGGKVIVS